MSTLRDEMGAEHLRRPSRRRHWPRIASLSQFATRGDPSRRKAAALETYDRWVLREDDGALSGPHHWVGRERLCGLLEEYVLDTKDDEARALAARTALRTILEEFATAAGADPRAVLVEKTPGHLYYAQTILESWPAARVVEVIRDGRDVCMSLQRKSRIQWWASADRPDQINRWVRAVRLGAATRRQPVAQGRWLPIHYEALMADTRQQVRRLFAFAGLATDDELVERTVSVTDTAAWRATDLLQHRRKGDVDDHPNHFSEDDHRLFRELAGDVFEAAGYRF
jgi:hypothetical protein